jgi:hypothetical protein
LFECSPTQILRLETFVAHLILLDLVNYNDQVKEDEMGRACSTNGGEEDTGGKVRWKETTGKTKA